MDVLVLGAAVLDITAQPIEKDGKWAEKQRIDKIMFTLGGDAANQCVRLSDVGVKAGIVSAVGNDKNGDMIKSELVHRGVDTSHLIVKNDYPTGTSLVLLDSKAERSTFSVQGGAYAALDKNDVSDIFLKDLKAVSVASFFVEPILEADGGMEAFLKRTYDKGIPTFADLSHDKNHLGLNGIKAFLPYIKYFLPSIYDAEKMNGIKGAEQNAQAYKDLGCENVIIKCGGEGCYIDATDFKGWIKAKPVTPVDTTGAGDCMVALFISQIIKGIGTEQACRFACDGATYSTLFYGAAGGAITPENIDKWKNDWA